MLAGNVTDGTNFAFLNVLSWIAEAGVHLTVFSVGGAIALTVILMLKCKVCLIMIHFRWRVEYKIMSPSVPFVLYCMTAF